MANKAAAVGVIVDRIADAVLAAPGSPLPLERLAQLGELLPGAQPRQRPRCRHVRNTISHQAARSLAHRHRHRRV
jgi:hypothetical protein